MAELPEVPSLLLDSVGIAPSDANVVAPSNADKAGATAGPRQVATTSFDIDEEPAGEDAEDNQPDTDPGSATAASLSVSAGAPAAGTQPQLTPAPAAPAAATAAARRPQPQAAAAQQSKPAPAAAPPLVHTSQLHESVEELLEHSTGQVLRLTRLEEGLGSLLSGVNDMREEMQAGLAEVRGLAEQTFLASKAAADRPVAEGRPDDLWQRSVDLRFDEAEKKSGSIDLKQTVLVALCLLQTAALAILLYAMWGQRGPAGASASGPLLRAFSGAESSGRGTVGEPLPEATGIDEAGADGDGSDAQRRRDAKKSRKRRRKH